MWPFPLKRYDDAVKAFNDAATLMPGDRAAQDLAAQAQQARTAAKTVQADEQKRLADFNRLMKDGAAAAQSRRYADAQKAYADALKLFPNDALAQQGQRQAQAGLETARQEEQKRLADFNRFIQQAQNALQARRYAEAQKAYGDALKLVPNDAAAQRGLQEATRALDASRPPPAPPKPPQPPKLDPQILYQNAMQNAATLEKQQKFAEALQAYQDALKHRPNDAKATQGVRNADFNNRLAEGQKHLQARRFAEAVREFEAALRIMPGNETATNLLNQAKKGKN